MSEKATTFDQAKKSDDKRHSENFAALPGMDDLSPEIGFQRIPPVDETQGGQMLSRARSLRRQLAGELGFLVSPLYISDDLRLKPRECAFFLRGLEIGRRQTERYSLLAVQVLQQLLRGSHLLKAGWQALGRRAAPPSLPLADSLKKLIGPHGVSASPVLVHQSPARFHLRRWLEPILPGVGVIALAEILPDIHLPAGVLR